LGTAAALAAASGAVSLALAAPGNARTGPVPAGDTKQIPVIVVLKNQHSDLNAKTARTKREQTTAGEQAPLVGAARAAGAKDIRNFSIVNGFAAKMSPDEAEQLRADPAVDAVVPDRAIPVSGLSDQARTAIKTAAGTPAPAAASPSGPPPPPADHVIPGSCPADPAKPLLEPEALQMTHSAFTDRSQPQAQSIVDGKGVKVAFVADGVDIHNPDFIRADGTPVFSDYQDFSGTDPNGTQAGAEAFGDASAIAAQGRQVYDLSKFVDAAHPLPAGCTITVRGVAPGASLVGLNVFGAGNLVTMSIVLQAVDYAVNVDDVDVINESLGENTPPTDGLDPVSLADDAAIAAGVTVVTSTGDAGPTSTIGQPATNPDVISVGATTGFRLYAQTGYAGTRNFATSWASDNSSALSSGGFTDRARVNDMVAPGQDGWALCTPDLTKFKDCFDYNGDPSPIEDFSGTSQAAPLVAGAAALVIEAYESTHGGVRPTPALVKQILTSTATDLGLPATEQGAGELNTLHAVRMAMSVRDGNGLPQAQGDGLLIKTGSGDTQISAVGYGYMTHTETVTVANTGASAQTVTAHGRQLNTKLADLTGSVDIAINDPNSPAFPDGYGTSAGPVMRRYTTTTFTVPPGADHLTGLFSYPGGGADGESQIRLALIGPNGEYEMHSDPQGIAHHGQVDLRHPAPGQWTAVFFGKASPTGYHGAVDYEFIASRYAGFGSVSPSYVVIARGATQRFQVTVPLPAQPCDTSAAVEFDTAQHEVSTIPVTLRTLLSPNVPFTGTLTGGNGRNNFSAAQEQSYYFDVPAGKKNLSVDLTLTGASPGHDLQAFLESPDHQVLSVSTNQVLDTNNNSTLLPSLRGDVNAPAPGRWLLFIDDLNPVVGTAIGQHFTGHLRYDAVDVSAAGLPRGKVAAGKPITATITVHNTGAAPEAYFADPRLSTAVDYQLVTVGQSPATVDLPASASGAPPLYQVPTHTTALVLGQTSTIPADFDAGGWNSSPEVYGVPKGLTASVRVTAREVTQGPWYIAPTAIGPTNAAVSGKVSTYATVHTSAFDPTTVASTGDLWTQGVNANAAALTPVVVQPGQTGTITVVINPSATSGTTVSGVLYVDDYSSVFGSGDELAGIPYRYTVQ
jgi:hypothetical protein